MSVLFAILLFSVLIFVHELGHFVAAKLSGVQVMGPGLPAIANHRINPAPGGRKQGNHPVIVPIICIAQYQSVYSAYTQPSPLLYPVFP